MSDLHELAVKTDTELAELYGQLQQLRVRYAAVMSDLHYQAGHYRHYVSRNRSVWVASRKDFSLVSDEQAVEDATTKLATAKPWDASSIQRSLDAFDDVTERHADLERRMTELNKVWVDNGRWSRFFLVQTNNGHIHSSMNCSTCRATTSFSWLPTVSGLTEAEAVEAHGPVLCSRCFPSAPVEWTLTVGQAKRSA